jgi:sugar phosphate isomerase/epimerase
MKIFGRTQTLARYPILACIEVLKRLGFDGVEVCLENPDLSPDRLTKDRARAVHDRLVEFGLSHSVSYHKDYIHSDSAFEQMKSAIRLVPAFGADVFVFGGGVKRGDAGEWALKVERTRELVSIAEDLGVVMAEEFEPDFIVGNTSELHRLFDQIPSDCLQANLDLGHVFLCDPDPMAAIASLEGRVAHCHVENMATSVHCHLPLWKGDMDLGAYVSALSDIGFTGPLALDLYNEDYEEVAVDSISFLRGLM